MVVTEESKILAGVKKRSKGGHDRVKDRKPRSGNRKLPGGIKNGVARVTGYKIALDKNDQPFFQIQATCVEDSEGSEEFENAGVFIGLMHRFEEDDYRTEEQNVEDMYRDLKLLGYDHVIQANDDQSDVVREVGPMLAQDKPFFKFTTGNKPTKRGDYILFVSGLMDSDYEPPTNSDDKETETAEQAGYVPSTPGRGRSKKKTAQTTCKWIVDGVVEVIFDNEKWEGTITEVDEMNSNATVKFQDGSIDEIPFGELIDEIPFEQGDENNPKEDEPKEEYIPEVNQTCVHLILKGTPEVIVTKVFKRKKTAITKNAESGKIYKETAWKNLQLVDE